MLLHELPADILIVFLCRYDLKDILKLEQTCRTIRDIVSTRQVWLAQLRRLDQTHAPNLPIHVDVLTLELNELREIVTTAVRAYDNCLNGTFGRTAHKPSHEISIKLDPPVSGGSISAINLVPGRNYLFALWSCGYIQLVDTGTRKAVWTYPEENKPRFLDTSPLESTSKSRMDLHGYGVDFRADGSASVVCYFKARRIVGRAHSNSVKGLIIDVLHIDFDNLEKHRLYKKVIESENGLRVLRVIVQGDFVAILCIATDDLHSESYLLTIANFITDEIVHAKLPQAVHKRLRPKIAIIREHLFLIDHDSNSFSSFRMLDIRHLFTVLPNSCRSPSINEPIDIGELGFSDSALEVPSEAVIEEATEPTLCSFHWKDERERLDTISVQFYIRVALFGEGSPGWSVLKRFAFIPRKSEAKPSALSLIKTNSLSPIAGSRSGTVTLHCRTERLPLSTRALMLGAKWEETGEPKYELVISTPIDRAGEDGSTLAVSGVPMRLGIQRFDVDHLSGAIISYPSKDGRWVKIAYPA